MVLMPAISITGDGCIFIFLEKPGNPCKYYFTTCEFLTEDELKVSEVDFPELISKEKVSLQIVVSRLYTYWSHITSVIVMSITTDGVYHKRKGGIHAKTILNDSMLNT